MRRIFRGISLVVPWAVILALGVLEFLSGKKAGVSHHLRFKRTYYLRHVLTGEFRWIFALVLAALVLYFVRRWMKREKGLAPVFWGVLLILSLVIVPVQGLMIYPYLVFGLCINFFLSALSAMV